MPEVLFEPYHAVLLDSKSFLFEHFLHKARRREGIAPAEFSFSVHDAVCWQSVREAALVQCPTDHTGRTKGQKIGNSTIRTYPAGGYLPNDGIYAFIVGWLIHAFHYLC